MACRESRLRYTPADGSRRSDPLWPVESPGFDTLSFRRNPLPSGLWPVESPGFDTLPGGVSALPSSLWPVESPGFDTLISCFWFAAIVYGLSRVPASIHFLGHQEALDQAMACRESRLRYTSLRMPAICTVAMACRESRLRYTLILTYGVDVALWPVESPGFDTLRGMAASRNSRLWPVESPGFDTL